MLSGLTAKTKKLTGTNAAAFIPISLLLRRYLKSNSTIRISDSAVWLHQKHDSRSLSISWLKYIILSHFYLYKELRILSIIMESDRYWMRSAMTGYGARTFQKKRRLKRYMVCDDVIIGLEGILINSHIAAGCMSGYFSYETGIIS